MKFEVLREHIGDRFYKTGDTRDADEISVKHLVRDGVLRPLVDKDQSDTNADQSQGNIEPVGAGTASAPTAQETPATEGQPITVSPDDVQILESRTFSTQEIAAAYEAAPTEEAAKDVAGTETAAPAAGDAKSKAAADLNKAQGAAPKNKAK